MRVRMTFPLMVLLCGAFMSVSASASEATNESTTEAAPCVDVEVNGQRAPSFNCLTQKLQPKAGAQQQAPDPGMASEAIANRPSNQLGLFNRAATSTRMGNTFGTSVYPQRPPPPSGVSPLVPHRP